MRMCMLMFLEDYVKHRDSTTGASGSPEGSCIVIDEVRGKWIAKGEVAAGSAVYYRIHVTKKCQWHAAQHACALVT